MQGGSLYHFYDGLWYDPAERRTHDLPCERRTRYRLSQPDTVRFVSTDDQAILLLVNTHILLLKVMHSDLPSLLSYLCHCWCSSNLGNRRHIAVQSHCVGMDTGRSAGYTESGHPQIPYGSYPGHCTHKLKKQYIYLIKWKYIVLQRTDLPQK